MEQLKQWDTELFLWLNRQHTFWADPAMYWITDQYFWYPMYGVLIFLLIRLYKIDGVWIALTAIAAIGLADYVASGLMKPFFERLRPCHELAIQAQVFVLRGCGGQYGFVSSHASTTFALATTFFLLARSKMSYVVFLFPWALLVAYSRVYVGVHYPLDVLVGALVGMICSVATILLMQGIRKQVVARRQR